MQSQMTNVNPYKTFETLTECPSFLISLKVFGQFLVSKRLGRICLNKSEYQPKDTIKLRH